jgi:hypothetical protein
MLLSKGMGWGRPPLWPLPEGVGGAQLIPRKSTQQVMLLSKGMGVGTTTFRAVLKMGHARDTLHYAGAMHRRFRLLASDTP